MTGTQKIRGEIERRIHEHLVSTPIIPTDKALQNILTVINDARNEFPDIVTYDKPFAEGVFMFANHCLAWAIKWLGLSTDSNRKIPILDSIRVEKTDHGEKFIWTYHFVERNVSTDD